MRRFVALVLFGIIIAGIAPAVTQARNAHQTKSEQTRKGAIPQSALDVYNYVVLHGRAPKGYVGGRVWYNRERKLPRGRYHEYDVHPKVKDVNRGAERIIVNAETNQGWYTGDHYRTFMPIPSTHIKQPHDAKPGTHLH